MKIYGYCRISTPKQNIERQVRNILKEYPEAIIVQETYSGTHYQGFLQSLKEIDDLHQRTRKGIETARRNGKQIGQKRGCKLKISKKIPIQKLILKHSKNFNGYNSDSEVIAIINASSFTPDGHTKPVRLHVSNNTYRPVSTRLR